MIVDIGNDIVSVKDIEQAISSSNRFLQRVFSQSEQEYCERKSQKFQHYAGFFSVKEAVMKALGVGWNEGIQWTHIVVRHNFSGKPEVQLYHTAKKRAEFLQYQSIHVSLSHMDQYATAVAILEK